MLPCPESKVSRPNYGLIRGTGAEGRNERPSTGTAVISLSNFISFSGNIIGHSCVCYNVIWESCKAPIFVLQSFFLESRVFKFW
jgi:hypothetical protein